MGESSSLAGRYRYVRELGRGAAGRVIEVRDELAAEPARLAVKTVPAADRARLLLEAERLRGLSHPNLVALHELLRVEEPLPPPFGLPAGTALLVEALAPGEASSEALLGLEGEALVARALAAAHGVASALTALHGSGLVHGDVKPANVVVDDGGVARLVDLGLASPPVEEGTVRGTPAFLAPESRLGTRSPATDLYALGVTLHRWLGGALPAYPGAPLTLPRAPGPVMALLKRLTAPEAIDRPPSARAAARELADLAGTGDGPRAALEPTGAERALAAFALPFEDPTDLGEELRERLEVGGVVRVSGPPGSGRSRLVREAAGRVQRERASSGEPIPTYVVDPIADPPLVPAIVHLTDGDFERATRLATVGRVARVPWSIVVEAAEGPEGAVTVGPLPADSFDRLLSRLLGGEPSAAQGRAAREASGALAGRLVRLFADGWLAGEDPTSVDVLRARAAAAAEEGALPPEAIAAGVRLALCGGRAPVDAFEPVREGLALLLRHGAAALDEDGWVQLRADRAEALASHGTAKRRSALARSLEPFDARSAAYLAAHRGEPATDAFATLATEALAGGDTADAERLAADGMSLVGEDERLQVLLFEARLAAARYDAARAAAPDDGRAAEALRRAGRVAEARALLEPLPAETAPITRGWLALAGGALDEAATHARGPAAGTLRVWIALMRGDPGEGTRIAREALAATPPPREAARLWSSLGAARHRAGDRRGARAAHERCLKEARALGERHLEASTLGNLGAAHLELGELGPAMDALSEGARRLAILGRDRDLARALANLASAALVLGDHGAARAWLDEAERCLDREPDSTTHHHLQGLRAEVALRRGDRDEARRAARVAAADARWEPRMVALLARHDPTWAGRWSGATDSFDAAIASLRVALSNEDFESAHRALDAAEPRDWAEALERAFAELDLAEGSHDHAGARAAAARARELLDEATRTLDPERRARMRRKPRYLRVLGARAGERRRPSDERWRRLGALAKRLGREEHPAALRQQVVDAALALVDAERALLVRRGPEGELVVVARAGVGADDAPSRSVVGRTLAGRAPVVSVDALADEALEEVASVHAMALRSVLSVPLRDRAEVLYMDDRMRTGVFAETDRRLMLDLADLAAIALDGAERLQHARDTQERLARAKRLLEDRVRAQERELAELRPAMDEAIVAQSPAMGEVVELAMRVADADVPVLLRGESGTGKELLARAIHRRGPRATAPFVAESCAAMPDSLVESLLFGHERGAFTGAATARSGLFRAADGGTLFLDEVGEMSPAMQAKILRVLQEGEVRPVGGTESHRVDVRLITATHRPLETWVQEGRFREDLFYRIAVMRIEVPPLRERPADVEPLARRFVDRHGEGEVAIAEDALDALRAHHWPGNVRELENEIRRALLSAGSTVTRADLSPALRGEADDPLDLKAQIAALETRLIREALARTEGNRTQAAQILGVSRYGLQKMLKRLAIE